MDWKHWRTGIVAVAALVAAPALAQEREDPIIEEDPEVRFNVEETEPTWGLSVRGGLSSYTGSLGDATSPGAFLGVQADSRPLNAVGVELGYAAARNSFEGDDTGALWRHNVSALAKVGPTINENLRPFVGAGFGVSYLNPSDQAVGLDNDLVTEIPLAAGLEYKLGGLSAGARATYHLLGGEDIGVDVGQEGNLFTAGVTLGGRF